MRRAISQSTQTTEVSPSRGRRSNWPSCSGGRGPGRGRAFTGVCLGRRLGSVRNPGDLLDAPSRGFDRLSRASGEFVGLDRQFLRKGSTAQYLEPIGAPFDQTQLSQQRFIHHRARIQPLEIDQVHDRVFDSIGRGKTELRQTALQWHLAALEAFEVHVSGTCFLSLAAAAGGLSPTGALSSPYPLLAMTGPGGSAQLREIHRRHLTLSYFR